ncbi:NAD(P)/FAD-dependent oxidoreductase [Gordonia hydrophobica]|uniref:FAD-dependent oxidoreductase n=1 Tax=Gordonia hydrophobica TaxID=40516 RepID=A0ABZ2U4H1_9ACTN|nr:FAD-dependent oxidoreductase [Gordonia hydrophobica]MBM7368079.1 3-phenylpropionate/trans-cinnamate dioxygenase ferredoxin reductase subunit [Gordonia hydrophobica]
MNAHVLVGGGVAAAATAAGLRDSGFDGRIVVVSKEPHVPYERPPLSKEFLAGTAVAEDLEVNAAGWYADHDVDLVLGTEVVGIDADDHRITLSDGASLGYRALVLATGVRARELPGFAGDRVHTVRTITDAVALREVLRPGVRLAVLGAGFIGCEVAATAIAQGAEVVLFDPSPAPMVRALGLDIGSTMGAVHAERGVDVRVGCGIVGMTHSATGLRLATDGGDTLDVDHLVVGVGAVPNLELAADAGIAVDNGIATDEYFRTSAPDVYAIGDVARRYEPALRVGVRVEHHDTAMRHGTSVARVLVGDLQPFTDQQFFWSDQYDCKLQSVGRFDATADPIIRGSVDERSFSAFSLVDGRVTGMVALNRPGEVLQARKLLGVPHQVTAAQLADDGLPLKRLLPRPARPHRSEVPA